MCGIAGRISKEPQGFDMEAALPSIARRGPDCSASFSEKTANHLVSFGHRRLSIIDLSNAGNQPMHEAGVSIIYNGEVYNYQALRHQHLSSQAFHSETDTEVILKLYLKLGANFVDLAAPQGIHPAELLIIHLIHSHNPSP